MVTPDQLITFLKKARYLTSEASLLEAKFVDINWKALTGFIFEKDFAGWAVLVTDVAGVLEDIVADGSVEAFAQIGIGVEARQEVLNVVNSFAVDYARNRSAEMVGMRLRICKI
jgi:hypothetical protein